MDRTQNQKVGSDLGMRSDLYTMLMPFFPEEPGLREYTASLGGHSIRISADDPETPIATPHDRKILNLLAGAIAHNIRSGEAPSRHVIVDTRTLVEAIQDGGSIGGSQYNLILDRLRRLMSTVIETEMPLSDGVQRRRRFRWIDAFEHDDKEVIGGRKILRLKITISEDAFFWMTRSLGFDISKTDFHALTSSRSSIWRIYEICLVRLISAHGATIHIPIEELRARIPIASQLKLFKSRTLKNALHEIANNAEMSAHLKVELARKTEDGYEVIDFSKRAVLETVFVRVSRGTGPLPHLNTILAKGEIDNMLERAESLPMTG